MLHRPRSGESLVLATERRMLLGKVRVTLSISEIPARTDMVIEKKYIDAEPDERPTVYTASNSTDTPHTANDTSRSPCKKRTHQCRS